jgi:putative serine/threonine protein kinase
MKELIVLKIKDIIATPYAKVLTYPREDSEAEAERLDELGRIGVTGLIFQRRFGDSELGVLGKGCVGIVVAGLWRRRKIAIKIRRLDAGRKMMLHEAEMLRIANGVNVGPRLYGVSDNVLLMQLIDGHGIVDWLAKKPRAKTVKNILRNVLEQCWRLDKIGLDHGELSRAPKHIIINSKEEPFIVDFETASVDRKPANVTSVCQFLFVKDLIRKGSLKNGVDVERSEIAHVLRGYKHNRTRESFDDVLGIVELNDVAGRWSII